MNRTASKWKKPLGYGLKIRRLLWSLATVTLLTLLLTPSRGQAQTNSSNTSAKATTSIEVEAVDAKKKKRTASDAEVRKIIMKAQSKLDAYAGRIAEQEEQLRKLDAKNDRLLERAVLAEDRLRSTPHWSRYVGWGLAAAALACWVKPAVTKDLSIGDLTLCGGLSLGAGGLWLLGPRTEEPRDRR